jgi:predicted amidohydrolase YtcJ
MMNADLILKSNAVFRGTAEAASPAAVIVKGDRIIDVTEPDGAERYMGDGTRVIEYEDKLIMPGFVDAHDHIWIGAVNDSRHVVSLQETTSEAEAIEIIKKYAAENPDEKRIRGEGWFPANWNDADLPTKISLDEAVPDRPAYMMCADGHTCWCNTKALEEAGYHIGMELEGGSLGTFENGELNGLIHEPAAMRNAWDMIFDFPDDQIEEIIEDLMKGLAAQGVTSVSEMNADGYEDMFYRRYRLFEKMADEGRLSCRVHVYTALEDDTDFVKEKAWKEEFSGDIFRISGFKMFLDGVTSTYTGLLLEPYSDRPDTCGEDVPLKTKEELEKAVTAANAEGFPVRIHCIAGGSVRMALDAFEASLKANGDHGLRNSIEHIETMHPDDLKRFGELGVIASMQVEHLILDSNEKIVRMGEERCRYEWPVRSLLDAGAPLALGTDFPVVKYNQLRGVGAAVTRRDDDGAISGVDNHENITLAEALSANTLGSARAYGRENELGTIEAGKLADIAVIDRNLFGIPADEIKDATVILTVMNGKIVHEI